MLSIFQAIVVIIEILNSTTMGLNILHSLCARPINFYPFNSKVSLFIHSVIFILDLKIMFLVYTYSLYTQHIIAIIILNA